MTLSREEREKRVLELYYDKGYRYREIARELRMSPNQIRAIIKRHEEKNEAIANKKKVLSLSSQAYKLFSQRKSLVDVTIELNLPGPEARLLFTEYLRLKQMTTLLTVYQELGDSIGYFLELVELGKKEALTPEQIIGLVKTNDNIHKLSEKFHSLQGDVIEIESRKFARKEELESLDKDKKLRMKNYPHQMLLTRCSLKNSQNYAIEHER
jgi:predicted DNA-binding protein YlxM (UPF0122 family)